MAGRGLGKLFAITLGGFAVGDWASNFFLHPGKKLDYGILNKFVGREVKNKFWGTRFEHFTVLPAYLAAVDIASAKMWGKFAANRGKVFGIKGTPLAMLFHCYSFAFAGILAYVVHNAAFNPGVPKGGAGKFIVDHIYPDATGCFSMLAFPITATGCAKLTALLPQLWFFFNNALTATTHFYMVKSIGFNDHVNPQSLTVYERELNDIKEEDM